MQSRSRLAVIAGAVVVATALVPAAGSASPAAGASPLDASAAQRASLLALLAQEPGGSNPQLVQLEQQLGTVQQQLLATRRQLDTLNAEMVAASQQIVADRRDISVGRVSLAELLRSTYTISGNGSLTEYVLSAPDFAAALDRLDGAQHMDGDLASALQDLVTSERSLTLETARLREQTAQAQQAEAQLEAESNRLLALIATRDLALANASSTTRTLIAQLDGVDQQASAGAAHPPVSVQGPCGNHFAFGQCTWYVATRRCIPWFGNAYQWWYAARQYGYPEGSQPAAGAVVVWYPNGGGASPVGHVAYVEAVGPGPGLPAGWFRLSEMNYSGWDQVDYRTLPDNSPGIAGFIY